MTTTDNNAHARTVLDGTTYAVLATADADGIPWATPVWFAHDHLERLYWLSWPGSRHSRFIEQCPEIALTVFDTTAVRNEGTAFYARARACQVPRAHLAAGLAVLNRRLLTQGVAEVTPERVTRRSTPPALRRPDHRGLGPGPGRRSRPARTRPTSDRAGLKADTSERGRRFGGFRMSVAGASVLPMTTRDELLSLSDFAWQRLRARLDGLTDTEHLWEPAPYCWTVRRGEDGRYHREGGLALDPPPVTTIAWRIWHIDEVLRGERNATWLGLEPEAPETRSVESLSAERAITDLEEAYGLWRRCLERADESGYHTLLGPIGGPYADSTRLAFILHELDELIHHGAEVGTMRDLYRAFAPEDPFAAAVLRADAETATAMLRADPTLPQTYAWLPARAASVAALDALRLMIELGFELNPRPGATSALHYAVANGDLEVVRTLVQNGADPSLADPTYQQNALGWAQHFGRSEVETYLAGLPHPKS